MQMLCLCCGKGMGLSVRPSVRLSVCPSVRPSVRLSVRLSVCHTLRFYQRDASYDHEIVTVSSAKDYFRVCKDFLEI